jgi:hypothetical protein
VTESHRLPEHQMIERYRGAWSKVNVPQYSLCRELHPACGWIA